MNTSPPPASAAPNTPPCPSVGPGGSVGQIQPKPLRFGCCGSMISPSIDPIGVEIIESLRQFGFDYIELSLSDIASLSPPAFRNLKQRIALAGIPCEACNNFFPARVRLTGHEARLPLALEYAQAALERAAALGVRVVVFGSSAAKNVPAGFPKDTAWMQIADLLHHLGPVAAQYGITLVIEPLNERESNIINLASEGLELVQAVNHPHIQLLIDYYHLMMEGEDLGIILQAGPALRHVHFAQVVSRAFPEENNRHFARFFDCLRQAGYSARCSIEAYSSNFAADAPRALQLLTWITSMRPACEQDPNPIFQPNKNLCPKA